MRNLFTEETLRSRRRKKFRKRVEIDSQTGCWEWTQYKDAKGRGSMQVYKDRQQAHRVAYELWVGPIPEDHHIHHTCLNKGCVNPDHLKPLTHREHMRVHAKLRRDG